MAPSKPFLCYENSDSPDHYLGCMFHFVLLRGGDHSPVGASVVGERSGRQGGYQDAVGGFRLPHVRLPSCMPLRYRGGKAGGERRLFSRASQPFLFGAEDSRKFDTVMAMGNVTSEQQQIMRDRTAAIARPVAALMVHRCRHDGVRGGQRPRISALPFHTRLHTRAPEVLPPEGAALMLEIVSLAGGVDVRFPCSPASWRSVRFIPPHDHCCTPITRIL